MPRQNYEIGQDPLTGAFEIGRAGTFGKTSVNEWGQTVHPRYLSFIPQCSGPLGECRRALKRLEKASREWAGRTGQRLPQQEIERIVIGK
jgi:hypothetical protein